MATHSSILAWKIPCTEEPGRLQVHGVTKNQTRMREFHFYSYYKEIHYYVNKEIYYQKYRLNVITKNLL